MNSLTIANHFTQDEIEGNRAQWFNNAQVVFRGLSVLSWDERNLIVAESHNPPSLVRPSKSSQHGLSVFMTNSYSAPQTLNIRWPVGPTAINVKPKWNVAGIVDPTVFCLTRRDFSLFRFFVSYNLLEPSRCIVEQASTGVKLQKLANQIVLFGYEKTGVPPTTYSSNCTFSSLTFQFFLDEEESANKSIEGMMNVICSNASWSLLKNVDCISKQNVSVDSIRLTQTSNREEWGGFPDLLRPITSFSDQTTSKQLQVNSTTHPNGNNVKMLNLDASGIYFIVPAWQHVASFFRQLAIKPEVFTPEEMTSIMQVGDRFYRVSCRSEQTTESNADRATTEVNSGASETQVAFSKQFLITLTSPQITLVSDATVQGKNSPCLTLAMAHLDILRQTTLQDEMNSVFCDSLEIFTDTANGPSSSVICPVLISGSLSTTFDNSNSPHITSGWVWIEELRARAAYTDLTFVIDVLVGAKEQLATPETMQVVTSRGLTHSKGKTSLTDGTTVEKRKASGRM